MESNLEIINKDKTIIEVLDKKWKKYLIPRNNILKAKYIISQEKNISPETTINIYDKDNNEITLMREILIDLNENNLTYHWLYIPDIENKEILVKKEQLIEFKISNEETLIMDYFAKKKKIITGNVCRIAKKYHSTKNEKGNENILFKIKDNKGIYHFVPKPIIKFAKKKRILNDEISIIEITDKDNRIIYIPYEIIRDFDEENSYNEWCEIDDLNGEKIIVLKRDLQDLKESFDKNYEKTIQEIQDFNYKKHEIDSENEYIKLFPEQYSYLASNGRREEFSTIKDLEKKEVKIKTSLIEHLLGEELEELGYYMESNDEKGEKIKFNPYEIIKDILIKYDDIICSSGPYIQLITQSGNKHLIKRGTIIKAIQLSEKSNNNNMVISIKDSFNTKIMTTLQKLKDIDLNNNDLLLIPLIDDNGNNVYIRKNTVIEIVNKIIEGKEIGESEKVKDYLDQIKVINVSQINMKNSRIKKNY